MFERLAELKKLPLLYRLSPLIPSLYYFVVHEYQLASRFAEEHLSEPHTVLKIFVKHKIYITFIQDFFFRKRQCSQTLNTHIFSTLAGILGIEA